MKLLIFILSLSFSIALAQIDSIKRQVEERPSGFTVDVMPKIIGGIDSLEMKINYPISAIKNKIEGKVFILAMIDTLGNPLYAKIIRGIGYGCDEEAVRLVMSSKFSAGESKGKKINSQLSIPIRFNMPKQE